MGGTNVTVNMLPLNTQVNRERVQKIEKENTTWKKEAKLGTNCL